MREGGTRPVIRTRALRKVYGEGATAVVALDGVDLEVFPGEFVSIMGTSGSGKTTLLHVLGCLHRPTSGFYEFGGNDVSALDDVAMSRIRNRSIGFVFQSYNLMPQEDIVDNAALPLLYARVPVAERRRRAAMVLTAMGLGDRLRHRPTELSGGQCQRVAIARAMVTRPLLLLADEPTGNLDTRTGAEIMGVFQQLNRIGTTIVQVTHDPEKARYSNKIVLLRDGRIERIVEVGDPLRAEAPDVDLTKLPPAELSAEG